MNTGLIIFGILFLINPNITIIDPFPDLIGCVFILFGMARLFPLSSDFTDSSTGIKRLAAISALRLVAVPIVIYLSAGDRSMYMLSVFIFAMIEPFFVIKFFFGLFNGLAQIASRSNAKAPILYLNQIKLITIIFFIIKNGLNIIPDLVYLKMSDGLDAYIYPMEQYKTPLLIICTILCLIASFVYLAAISGYFRRIKKDADLKNELKIRIENAAGAKTANIVINTKKALLLLLVGFAFLIDIYIDGYNILPDIIGIVFIFASVSVLAKVIPNTNKIKLYILIYSCLSVLSIAYNYYFAYKYYKIAEYALNRIMGQYVVYILLYILSSAAMLLLLWKIRAALCDIVDNYTASLSQCNTPIFRQMLKKRLLYGFIIGSIFEVFSALGALIIRSAAISVIAALIGICFVVFMYNLFNDINEGISNISDV